jgi:glutathione S-transferase
MKLYNVGLSPNCVRVRAVADELGFPLEIVEVDLRAGSDELKALNPNGKVPTLVDGDVVLWESRAINAYLANKDPAKRLYPDDLVARAQVDQWSYWQAIHLGPAMQRVGFERALKKKFGMGEPNEDAIADQVKETDKLLGVLDKSLAGRDWIAGDLSLADFALASTFPFRGPARISLDAVPNVAAWIGRMEERQSWKKATAPVLAFMAA